jgi:hypothetical protein
MTPHMDASQPHAFANCLALYRTIFMEVQLIRGQSVQAVDASTYVALRFH